MTLEHMTFYAKFFLAISTCSLALNVMLLAASWWLFSMMQSYFDELVSLHDRLQRVVDHDLNNSCRNKGE